MHAPPDGIANLQGRAPVGAVLTIGIKKDGNPRGFPVEKDRFHLVVPREANGVRLHHPGFSAFNRVPRKPNPDDYQDASRLEADRATWEAELGKRRVIRGNIVHGTQRECFEHYLRAQVLPGHPAHPDRRPACIGDGKRAVRYTGVEGGGHTFRDIECPNERCEFRQRKGDKPTPCKPFARLLFRIRWAENSPLPTPLVKYTTGAWNTTANLLGFFTYLDDSARQLGLDRWTLFGFPFTLTWTEQTKPSETSRFPVVVITPDADPMAFFDAQRVRLRELQEPVRYAALTDAEEQDTATEDFRHVSVSIPSAP
jgi:hypothetical protein